MKVSHPFKRIFLIGLIAIASLAGCRTPQPLTVDSTEALGYIGQWSQLESTYGAPNKAYVSLFGSVVSRLEYQKGQIAKLEAELKTANLTK